RLLLNEEMREPERENLVGAGKDPKPLVGASCQRCRPRTNNDHPRAALQGFLHLDSTRQPCRGGIVAPQQHAIRRGEIRRADIVAEGETGRDILVPVTNLGGVDDVGAAEASNEPLDPGDRVRDVRAAWRGHRECDLLGPMLCLYCAHATRDFVEGFVPCDGLPAWIGRPLGSRSTQRNGQSILVLDELGRALPLWTQLLAAGMTGRGLDPHEPALLNHGNASAARSTLRAECRDAFCRGQGGLSTLAAHAFPGRIINGFAHNCRLTTSTQDFHLDAPFRLREARGHIAERKRLSNPMAVAARGDPAYWRAIMENGLVP